MSTFIKTFRATEDGAVTIDWVVLTAALAALGVAVLQFVGTSADGLAGGLTADVTPAPVITDADVGS